MFVRVSVSLSMYWCVCVLTDAFVVVLLCVHVCACVCVSASVFLKVLLRGAVQCVHKNQVSAARHLVKERIYTEKKKKREFQDQNMVYK